MDFFPSLVRSREALGKVGATPGAPSAAAEGMDGSDDRADGYPRGGKGVKVALLSTPKNSSAILSVSSV